MKNNYTEEDNAVINDGDAYCDGTVLYTASARNRKGLSREEEAALGIRISAGDISAVNELIENNLGLALSLANKYYRRFNDGRILLDDLIEEANIELVRCSREFDWTRGNKFSTYAYSCINYKLISVTTSITSGREDYILDSTIGDSDETYLIDTIPDITAAGPEELAVRSRTDSDVRNILLELSPEEREVLCLCTGYENDRPVSPTTAARKLGMKPSKAKSLLASAEEHFRNFYGDELLVG